jgi:hypothetical protein
MKQKYRLTKINKVENPLAETANSVDEYRESLDLWNGYELSPSIDYYVEGTLVDVPTLGQCLEIERTNRNGVEVYGIMSTTKIKAFEQMDGYIELRTENSIYRLEKI